MCSNWPIFLLSQFFLIMDLKYSIPDFYLMAPGCKVACIIIRKELGKMLMYTK